MQRFAAIWITLLLCLQATTGEFVDKSIDHRWDHASVAHSESANARTLTAFVGHWNSTIDHVEEDDPLPPGDDDTYDEDEETYLLSTSSDSRRARRPPPPRRRRPPPPKKRPPPPKPKRKPPPPPKRRPPPPKPKRKPPPPPKRRPPLPKPKRKSPPPPKKRSPPPPKREKPPPPPPKKSPPPPPKNNPPPPQENNGERPKAVSRSQMCQSRNLLSRGIVGGRRYGIKYYHACLNRVSKSMDCCEQCREAEGCQGWFFTRLDCSAFSASTNAGVCYLLADALLAYEDPATFWNGGVQWTAEQDWNGWNLGSDWDGGSAVAMETGQEIDRFELSY